MATKPTRNEPLAYLITFNCYGKQLHGETISSVGPHHNAYDSERFPEHSGIEEFERDRMTQPPYHLDEPRRKVVLRTIIEVCNYRGWELIAAHVRSNHVHAVVCTNEKPEKVMKDFKMLSSRRLTEAGLDSSERKRWARHGSTVYKWTQEDVGEAVDYVVSEQGDPPMEIYQKK